MPSLKTTQKVGFRLFLLLILGCAGCLPTANEIEGIVDVQQTIPGELKANPDLDPSITVPASNLKTRTFMHKGKLIDEVIVPGRPPVIFRAKVAKEPVANLAAGINTLTNVPAFNWC